MLRMFIGPKQKTIENNDFFDKSITLVGENVKDNISLSRKLPFDYWNPDNNVKEIDFYTQEIAKIFESVEIMAHNPNLASKCTFNNNVHLICMNTKKILDILDDKIKTRKLFNGIVPMLKYSKISGKTLIEMTPNDITSDLVIQLPFGSGGSKTFLYTKDTIDNLKKNIISDAVYSVSEYQKDNVPYNIHCMIGDNEIQLFSPSEQDLEITDKIEYIGSFFVITISTRIKQKMINYSEKICKKLQNLGYRGVLGIDWIYTNEELYFIEINPRFQGSTRQVDLLLKKSGLPSIFEYNYLAFNHKILPDTKKMLFSLYE